MKESETRKALEYLNKAPAAAAWRQTDAHGRAGKGRPAYPNLRSAYTMRTQLRVLAGCWYPQTVANTAEMDASLVGAPVFKTEERSNNINRLGQ